MEQNLFSLQVPSWVGTHRQSNSRSLLSIGGHIPCAIYVEGVFRWSDIGKLLRFCYVNRD